MSGAGPGGSPDLGRGCHRASVGRRPCRRRTSDHRFGQANIIRYSGRSFANAGEVNRAVVGRWNDADADGLWTLDDSVMSQLTVNPSAHVWLLKGREFLVPATTTPAGQTARKAPTRSAAYHGLGGIARIVEDLGPPPQTPRSENSQYRNRVGASRTNRGNCAAAGISCSRPCAVTASRTRG